MEIGDYGPQDNRAWNALKIVTTNPLTPGTCWRCHAPNTLLTIQLDGHWNDGPVFCTDCALEELVILFRSSDDPRWYTLLTQALATAMKEDTRAT